MKQKRFLMKRMLCLLVAALLFLQSAGFEGLFGMTAQAAEAGYTYEIHIFNANFASAPTVKDLSSGSNLALNFTKNGDGWWIAKLETNASLINAQINGVTNMGSFGDGSFTLSPNYPNAYLWYLSSNSDWATAYVNATSDGSATITMLGWEKDGTNARTYSVTGGMNNWDGTYQALDKKFVGSANFPSELIPTGQAASAADTRTLFQKTFTGLAPGEDYYFRMRDSYGTTNTYIPNDSKAACFTVPVSEEDRTFTVNFHYHRYAEDYTDWGAYVKREDNEKSKTVDFGSKDGDGWATASYTLYTEADSAKISFLLKKGDWDERDITSSRYVEFTLADDGQTKDIWLLQHNPEISETKGDVDLSPRLVSATANSKLAVTAFLAGKSTALNSVDYTKFYVYNETDNVKIPNYTAKKTTDDLVSITYSGEVFVSNKHYSVRHESTGTTIWCSVTMGDILNNYTYTGSDLGLTYGVNTSAFKLWAPTAKQVRLLLYNSLEYGDGGDFDTKGKIKESKLKAFDQAYNMSYDNQTGVYSCKVNADLNGRYYMYEVTQNDGTVSYAVDPYARSVSANGQLTAIIDLSTTGEVTPVADKYSINNSVDQVLYEVHVRDFSIDDSSGMVNKGKFLAFTETGTTVNGVAGAAKTGIDHLKELGITTVHLLPSYDYGSVNELGDLSYGADGAFNWGYDPQNYNVPEGSYSTNAKNPTARVKEFKEMVNALHEAGIRVVMDVVYNHTYSVDDGPFQKIVPDYYYRTNEKGFLTDGSGCGNEVASEQEMVRKYITDSVLYWQEEYGIDGFRFDLMALIDTTTMSQLTQALQENDPDCIIYGEPWTGDFKGNNTGISYSDRTVAGTQKDRGFAVFNDNFRGLLKGGSDNNTKGFATEESVDEKQVMAGVKGSFYQVGGGDGITNRASETINYVTAHDNLNLWDKIRTSYGYGSGLAANPYGGGTENFTVAKQSDLLMMGIIFTSQGVPFFQAGDEFLRSKKGDHNSYSSGDEINAIDWTNKTTYADVNAYYQGLLQLRREHPAFRLDSIADINAAVEHIREANGVIAYKLKNNAGGDSWKNIYVLYNGGTSTASFTSTEIPSGLKVVVNDTQAGTTQIGTDTKGGYSLPAHSMAVLYEDSSLTKEPQLAAVSVSPKTLSLNEGDKSTLKLKGLDTESKQYSLGNISVEWISKDSSVAKIGQTSGQIEAVGAGKTTITARTMVNGKAYTAACEVAVTAKKYVIFEYDGLKTYPGSTIYVWVDGGRPGSIYSFNRMLDSNGACIIELPATTQKIGYIVLQGGSWDTREPLGGKVSEDRFIELNDTEPYTKVLIRTGQTDAVIRAQAVSSLDMASNKIYFRYRDLNLFRISNDVTTNPAPKVKVTVDGSTNQYTMSYDSQEQLYNYTLSDIEANKKYQYQFSLDGGDTWINDPYNTESVFDTASPKISASFAHSSFNSEQLNVLSVKGDNIKSVTADFTDIGGNNDASISSVVAGKFEKTVSIPQTLGTGTKTVKVSVTMKGGSVYIYSLSVTVEQTKTDTFDWDEARIYFLLTDRFAKGDEGAQTSGNSNLDYHGGDFKGLISQLDYLQDLGINTIWITPIVDNMDITMADGRTGYHGYWTKSFEKIDEHLGTLADFENLIEAVHDRDMKLMVDVVLNHAGYSMNGKVKSDWTGTFPNASEIGAFMLNGTSMFRSIDTSGDDVRSESYELPDFLTEDVTVRQQLVEWQTKWMTDYDIDYFRVDTVKNVDHETWQAFKNSVITSNSDFKLIGEVFDYSVGTATQSDYHNAEEMDSLLDFNFKNIAKSFAEDFATLSSVQTSLKARETLLDNNSALSLGQFLSSHDEDSFATRLTGDKQSKLMTAAALQITAAGQPVIYYGEEVGQSGPSADDANRYDFNWNWEEDTNATKLHDHYKALLKSRDAYSKVFSKGNRNYITTANTNVLLFTAEYEGETVLTAINRSTTSQNVTVPVSTYGNGIQLYDVYSSMLGSLKTSTVSGGSVTITVPSAADGGTAIYADSEKLEKLEKPTASITSGTTVATGTKLTLTAHPGASVYYTTDGTAPTTSSTKYNSAITLTGAPGQVITVNAYATMLGMEDSEVATFTYTIDEKLAAPDVSAGWNGSLAQWKAVAGADQYKVQLKKGSALIDDPVILESTVLSYDFKELIQANGAGSYTYMVQAFGQGFEDSIIVTSTSTIENHTITYAANGGSGTMSSETALKGSDYKIKANEFVPQTGYEFNGWTAGVSASGNYQSGAEIKNITGNIILTAQWKLNQTTTEYTISYQLNGGTQAAGQANKYTGGVEYVLKNPTRVGYTFEGWYSDITYKTKVKTIAKTSTGPITLYANWTANTYSVKFLANGGSGTMSAQTLTYDSSQALKANTFQRKGYVFAGWALSGTGAKKYNDKASVKNLSAKNKDTITLYAKWTQVTAPGVPKSLKLQSKKAKQLTVSYKKVTGAAGYKITYSTSSKFTGKTTKVKYTTKNNYTIKNLKKNTKYYVKVSAYKVDSTNKKVTGKDTSAKNKVTK